MHRELHQALAAVILLYKKGTSEGGEESFHALFTFLLLMERRAVVVVEVFVWVEEDHAQFLVGTGNKTFQRTSSPR